MSEDDQVTRGSGSVCKDLDHCCMPAARKHSEALEARIAALEAALEPFASSATWAEEEYANGDGPDLYFLTEEAFFDGQEMTLYKDCVAARAALENTVEHTQANTYDTNRDETAN